MRLAVIAVIAGLAACAAPLDMRPAQLTAGGISTSPPAEIQVAEGAVVTSSQGRHRQLEAGSRWQLVGRIEQGKVYKRVDGVFMVQARDVHEAYLVISSTRLVGFYLPVENSFSPAVPTVQLTLRGNP